MVKKVCLGCVLVLVAGALLFPRQIVLQSVKWVATRYCQRAYGAKLHVDQIAWEEGTIIFREGRLYKEGELNVSFDTAALLPLIDWRHRVVGGKLDLKQLRIVHSKKESRPIPSPPSPALKFVTLQLDTTIEKGELLLYDYLAKDHFFQKLKFDVTHHIHGRQTWGRISFDWNPKTPPFIAHFHSRNEQRLEVTAHFQDHSFPVLSHLATYFFERYLPAPAFQWNILKGKIDGDLELVLCEGAPLIVKGRLDLCGVEGENQPLKLQGEVEHLGCIFDVDLSDVSAINGEFELVGGKLALEPEGEFWRGMCDLNHLQSRMRIKEGKVESSTVKGNLVGMEGELVLDWQADETLMQMAFQGNSRDILARLPERMRNGFAEAFPGDDFKLKAALKRAEDGLELQGELLITDQSIKEYQLAFGCLLGKGEVQREVELALPQGEGSRFSQSVDAFLERLKGQFCLSQKRFGWFHGQDFPLEKFLSPFLLRDVPMLASGLADFKGTFDQRYMVVFYEGKDFCIESPSFKLHVDRVKEHLASEISAVHYLDLKTWDHVGFLPLKAANYQQKNYNFQLEDASALVHFENNQIHIQDIATRAQGLAFQGNVDVTVHSKEHVEMVIEVDQLEGTVKEGQQFLAHFKPSLVCEIPLDAHLSGGTDALYFHYDFSPKATLREGRVHAEIQGSGLSACLGGRDVHAVLDYDCLTLALEIRVMEQETILWALDGLTEKGDEGKQITIKGTGPAPYETIHFQTCEREHGKKSRLDFTCGPWEGGVDLAFEGERITLDHFICSAGPQKSLALSGTYDKGKKSLTGHLEALRWDVTPFFSRQTSGWKLQGMIEGAGPLVCSVQDGICSVEGLQAVVTTGLKEEKYSLGRLNYDTGKRKIHFEGFDFSIGPDKLPWVFQACDALFPTQIDPVALTHIRQLKRDEPIEGHLSLEASPDNVWICLSLKDGLYHLGDHDLDLKHFCLVYDPLELNISTQCRYNDRDYWVQLHTDSTSMEKGTFTLSEDQQTKAGLTTQWRRDPAFGLCVDRVSGSLCGMDVAFTSAGPEDMHAQATLTGRIHFNPAEVAPLLPPNWRKKVEQLGIAGFCTLEGELALTEPALSAITFVGTLSGQACQAAGVSWSELSSQVTYSHNKLQFSDCIVRDRAGKLSLKQLAFTCENHAWKAALDHLHISDVRLARINSPWTQWSAREKPFLRSLVIRSFALDQCEGDLSDLNTLLGGGQIEFSNVAKKTLLSNLLFIPSEITARIGLDLSALVPARGVITYNIQDGKIFFNEFKQMYSDGKLSRFYLAEGFPAYIDFQGNLNLKVKMKQYNLLMKLAEFFTITVKGTLLDPSYTFSNHIDEDDN